MMWINDVDSVDSLDSESSFCFLVVEDGFEHMIILLHEHDYLDMTVNDECDITLGICSIRVQQFVTLCTTCFHCLSD